MAASGGSVGFGVVVLAGGAPFSLALLLELELAAEAVEDFLVWCFSLKESSKGFGSRSKVVLCCGAGDVVLRCFSIAMVERAEDEKEERREKSRVTTPYVTPPLPLYLSVNSAPTPHAILLAQTLDPIKPTPLPEHT